MWRWACRAPQQEKRLNWVGLGQLGTHTLQMKKKELEERWRKMQRREKKEGGGGKADLAVTGALGEILAASLFLVSFLL